MNILIVDDNRNNRMILRLLLEDYMEENDGIHFSIQEAEDGQIAVDKCAKNEFNLILMDIMMPNMDGIEATKIIRQKDKKIMIIAVSAVDDGNEGQKLILNNGAEDYIAKPVNANIFISRMANYIALSEARKTKKVTSDVCANLFTKNIFSRHVRFIITSEDSLSEFWEYYLLSTDIKCDDLSDVVRTIFAIAEIQRKLNINSDIFVEDSEYKKYFTLSNIGELPKKIVELTLRRNNYLGDYKIENGKISFELNLIYADTEELVHDVEKEKSVETVVIQEEVKQSVIMTSEKLVIQDYIDHDDLFDLEEYGNKLNSIMLLVSSGEITEEEVMDIYTYLDRIASILGTYSEVYPIAQALSQLSVDMQMHAQVFIDNSEALGPMCKAFSNDMSNWIEMSFHTGAPSANFMNDTIVVNTQTIGNMLTMNDAPADGGDDFDDIFDF